MPGSRHEEADQLEAKSQLMLSAIDDVAAATCPLPFVQTLIWRGAEKGLRPEDSKIHFLRYRQGIIDAKVSNGAFNFRVAEQKLHGTEVAGLPID